MGEMSRFSIKNRIFRLNSASLFSIFLVLVLLVNTLWIILDEYAPRGNGKEFVMELSEIQELELKPKIDYLFSRDNNQPPLIEITFMPFYYFFGMRTKNELVINSIYLGILVLSVYKIGSLLYSKRTGLLAAVLISSFPVIISLSRETYREFHLMCFASLSFWLMLNTDYLGKTKDSVGWGISLGLALLTRYDSIIYLLPQSLFYSVVSLIRRKKGGEFRQTAVNLMIVLLIVAAIAGSWYADNSGRILRSTGERFSNEQIEIDKKNFALLSPENLLYFWDSMFYPNLGILFGSLALASVIYTMAARKRAEEVMLLFTLFMPYLVFLFIPIKSYTKWVPVYFIIPLLISRVVTDLKLSRNAKMVLVSVFSLYCIAIVLSSVIPFGLAYIPVFYNNRLEIVRPDRYGQFREMHLPSENVSLGEKIFRIIEIEDDCQDSLAILLLSNGHTEYWDIRYLSNIYGKGYKILAEFRKNEGYYLKWSFGGFPRDFRPGSIVAGKQVDYVVLFFSGDTVSEEKRTDYRPSYDMFAEEAFKTNYKLIREIIETEDGHQTVQIYKKN
ncbi:glycosyltransferase family 39 protein [Candidatus Woesearchaeota archaeon]|nr:glycosyltransferase family 39 protein [Candidatus Woesearchaeota archaeon]